MTYLDELAAAIRASVPEAKLPDGDTQLLFRLYAVLALAKGDAVSLADVHDAWAAWMLETNESHESIRPFEALDPATRAQDQPYADAIRGVAREQGLGQRARP